MSQVRIMLAPGELLAARFDRPEGISFKDMCVANQRRYVILPPMQCAEGGEEAAEEMFELTNNPSRQTERYERYGNGRSLSVGDMVEVDLQRYLCDSVGWVRID